MKTIELSQGLSTLVDDADFAELSRHKWYAAKKLGEYYAQRNTLRDKKTGKRHTIHMARQILGLVPGDGLQSDHENHDTLDNQRDNLRVATYTQNQHNRKSQRGSTSRFKGVSWRRATRKWQAYIRVDAKHVHLGLFHSETAAAHAYDAAALEYFGVFASLNFPEE